MLVTIQLMIHDAQQVSYALCVFYHFYRPTSGSNRLAIAKPFPLKLGHLATMHPKHPLIL